MPDEAAVATQQEQQAESAAKASETEQAAASAAAETSETQTDQSAGEGGEPPKKGGVQRRIDELTRDKYLAQARAEYFEKLALSKGATGEKPPEKVLDAPKPKPNPADFETTEAYLDAWHEWVREDSVRAAREELQKAEQTRMQQSEVEELAADWVDREEQAKERHPDYEEVAGIEVTGPLLQSAKGPSANAIALAIQHSELGPELLYHFCKNPEELRNLARMTNRTQAVLALGRIEARLAPENEGGEGKTPPQTRAPKPPNPVRKPSAAATPFDPTNPASYGGDFGTYKQQMDARELAAKKK